MVNFGKNTYQYEIVYKFDCLSIEFVNELARHFVGPKKRFSMISKDAGNNHTIMSTGAGTEVSPLFQLRIGADRLIFWGGWFVSLDQWHQHVNQFLPEISQFVRNIPVEFIGNLTSQCNFAVPSSRLRRATTVPELEPVVNFYQKFVPKELLKRGNLVMAFADEQGREVLSWGVGGGVPVAGHENIGFTFRWNTFEDQLDLKSALLSHFSRYERFLEDFQRGFLSLIVDEHVHN